MKRYCLLFKIIFFCCALQAQDFSLYEKHWYVKNRDTLPYRLLLPKDYQSDKKYPLILFLHGSGECGNDNEKQLKHLAKVFLLDSIRNKYPAIVVFPQCPVGSGWNALKFSRDSLGRRKFEFPTTDSTKGMVLVDGLLGQLRDDYPIEKKRIYVSGLSLGGFGTYAIVSRHPKLFAAAVPMCGGGDTSVVQKLKKTKWWIFHGAKDNAVPLVYSQQMHQALQSIHANSKLTIYEEAGHNCWDQAFAEPDLFAWLFAQRKK